MKTTLEQELEYLSIFTRQMRGRDTLFLSSDFNKEERDIIVLHLLKKNLRVTRHQSCKGEYLHVCTKEYHAFEKMRDEESNKKHFKGGLS